MEFHCSLTQTLIHSLFPPSPSLSSTNCLWPLLVHAAGGAVAHCVSLVWGRKRTVSRLQSPEPAPLPYTHLSQRTNSMVMHIAKRIRDPNNLLHPTSPPPSASSENSTELCSLAIWVSSLLCGGYICTECKYSLIYLILILNIFLFHFCLFSGLRPSLTFSVYLPGSASHINGHLISDFGHDGIIKSFCIGNYTWLDSRAGLV